jgi:hypothetical protein
MCKPVVATPGKPISMGHNQGFNVLDIDGIHQCQKFFTAKVYAASPTSSTNLPLASPRATQGSFRTGR